MVSFQNLVVNVKNYADILISTKTKANEIEMKIIISFG